MFILDLSYIAPVEAADAHMDAHVAWLQQGYDSGMFLASGRKNPRTGGIILARGERAAVEAFCAADPFTQHRIAEYRIMEAAVSRTAAGLEALKG